MQNFLQPVGGMREPIEKIRALLPEETRRQLRERFETVADAYVKVLDDLLKELAPHASIDAEVRDFYLMHLAVREVLSNKQLFIALYEGKMTGAGKDGS